MFRKNINTIGQLKFATFNAVSLITRKRKQWVLNLLLKENVDIAVLQETKLNEDHIQNAIDFFDRLFEFRYSNAIAHSGGAAVLIRKNKGFHVYPEWEHDQSGRVCAVDVLHRGEAIRVISVHAPNAIADRKTFFTNLRQYLSTPMKTILAGDFNCVLGAQDSSTPMMSDSSRGELKRLLRDYDLQDVTEVALAPTPGFTHWQGTCHSRLDRIYSSSDLAQTSFRYVVGPVAFSDHAIVSVSFGTKKRKKRLHSNWQSWKLNDSVLQDTTLRTQITELIGKHSAGKPIDAVKWELLKGDLKVIILSYCQKKASDTKAEKRLLFELWKR